MSDLGDRLRDERKRLGLNQIEFAVLGGVKKNAQMNYESGERSPDSDYLCALLKVGVDITYILTGSRAATSLDSIENNLITGFRLLDQRGKLSVLALINGMNPTQPAPQNVFQGGVGQIVHGDITTPQTFNFDIKNKDLS